MTGRPATSFATSSQGTADAFGTPVQTRGVLLAGFGAAGLVCGPVSGRLVERSGARRCLSAAGVAAAVLVGTIGLADSTRRLGVQWAMAGVAASLLVVATNTLAVAAAPANRGGAVSTMSAFRFTGNAVAPLL